MYADLHIHSHYSDGTYSPQQLVKEAINNNIGTISVCDHNTTKVYETLPKLCKENCISLINGVEIDCNFNNRNIHILAYDFDLNNKDLQKLLDYNVELMERLSDDLIEKMQNDYKNISTKEYKNYQRVLSNGGWKGIDYLKSKGFKTDYPECMKYYADYSVTPIKPYKNANEVFDIIHNAGGKAVIAHPADKLLKEKFTQELNQLLDIGLDGIECYYPSHSEQTTAFCVDFCNKNNLFITAGSDSHGEFAKVVNNTVYSMEQFKVKKSVLSIDFAR